jgi:chemotaxis response regulator CheB
LLALKKYTSKFVNRIQNESRFPIVGIGASAGGLDALTELLQHLPPDTGMGFVLVQHLDPEHESALTQILSRATSMPVCEVVDNLPVETNHIYVIPPNRALNIAKGKLKLSPRSKSQGPLRTIDFFLDSLARDQRECAIGVILSGTASDGTLGLCAIVEAFEQGRFKQGVGLAVQYVIFCESIDCGTRQARIRFNTLIGMAGSNRGHH